MRGKALAESAVGEMPYKLAKKARKAMEVLNLMAWKWNYAIYHENITIKIRGEFGEL